MTSSAIFAEYDKQKIKGRKTPPAPITAAEIMHSDLRNMSQDEVNRAILTMESQFQAEDQLRELFSGRVAKLYAAERRFRYVDLFCGAGGSFDANGGSWNTGPASVDDTFRTRTTKDWEALVVPPGAFVDTARNHAVPTSIHDTITTVSAGGNHQGIVVPYNRTGVAYPTSREFGTVTTKDRAGLITGWDGASMDELIDNSHYRMIQWYEQLLAQAFPLDYLMTGNIGERTAGAGNAVSCNVAGWLGMCAGDALERTSAGLGRPRRKAKAGTR